MACSVSTRESRGSSFPSVGSVPPARVPRSGFSPHWDRCPNHRAPPALSRNVSNQFPMTLQQRVGHTIARGNGVFFSLPFAVPFSASGSFSKSEAASRFCSLPVSGPPLIPPSSKGSRPGEDCTSRFGRTRMCVVAFASQHRQEAHAASRHWSRGTFGYTRELERRRHDVVRTDDLLTHAGHHRARSPDDERCTRVPPSPM